MSEPLGVIARTTQTLGRTYDLVVYDDCLVASKTGSLDPGLFGLAGGLMGIYLARKLTQRREDERKGAALELSPQQLADRDRDNRLFSYQDVAGVEVTSRFDRGTITLKLIGGSKEKFVFLREHNRDIDVGGLLREALGDKVTVRRSRTVLVVLWVLFAILSAVVIAGIMEVSAS